MPAAQKYQDLIAWQLSARLRDDLIARSAGWQSSDRKFCDQIRDSARSAPRNLAEGFGHFNPREFARFTRIARASLMETLNHLDDALASGYLNPDEANSLSRLNKRAIKATTGLLKYLASCKGKSPTGWDVPDRHRGERRCDDAPEP